MHSILRAVKQDFFCTIVVFFFYYCYLDILLYSETGYNVNGDVDMERFSPRKPEQIVTTVRIPKAILERIDKQATKADISRNEFINQCILYALDSMEEKN